MRTAETSTALPNPRTNDSGEVVRKTVVLDTSVLVADPDSLEGFADADIVLPLTVIEELDNLKTRQDEVGWAARSALRAIEAARVRAGGDIREPVERRSGGTIRVETNGLHVDENKALNWDASKGDNRILAACLGLRSMAPDAIVQLVSSDVALRIKGA